MMNHRAAKDRRDQQCGGTGVTAGGGDAEDHRRQPQRTRSQSDRNPHVGATHGPPAEPPAI